MLFLSLLPPTARYAHSEAAFFRKLFSLLDIVIKRTRPQYSVTLALDGPAPIAKTVTQRKRRIRLSAGEKAPLSSDPGRLLKIGLTPVRAEEVQVEHISELTPGVER